MPQVSIINLIASGVMVSQFVFSKIACIRWTSSKDLFRNYTIFLSNWEELIVQKIKPKNFSDSSWQEADFSMFSVKTFHFLNTNSINMKTFFARMLPAVLPWRQTVHELNFLFKIFKDYFIDGCTKKYWRIFEWYDLKIIWVFLFFCAIRNAFKKFKRVYKRFF